MVNVPGVPYSIGQWWSRFVRSQSIRTSDSSDDGLYDSEDDTPEPVRFFETKRHGLHGLPLCGRCAALPFAKRRNGEALALFVIDSAMFETFRTCRFCALVVQAVQLRIHYFRPDQPEWIPLQLMLNSSHDRLCTHGLNPGEDEYLKRPEVMERLNMTLLNMQFNGSQHAFWPPNTAQPRVMSRRRSTTDAQISGKIRKAVPRCCRVHKVTQTNGKLPDRVLELHKCQGTNDQAAVRLVDTNGKKGSYATLSHCWGGLLPSRTTTNNIRHHRAGIKVVDLPPSFRDAVFVTQALGLHHLWIDALCIIQDDRQDWEEQAPKMRQIYSQSLCTIAAHSAANSGEGFLGAFSVSSALPCTIQSSEGHQETNMSIEIPDLTDRAISLAMSRSKIQSRGWVFQELILSPRVLHVVENRFLWECTCPRMGKAKIHDLTTTFGKTFRTKNSWLALIEAYTRLDLSRNSDRLPAIQGIVQAYMSSGAFARLQSRYLEYFEGVFFKDIHSSLLWSEIQPRVQWLPSRAATWSWASREGALNFFSNHIKSDDPYVWLYPYAIISSTWRSRCLERETDSIRFDLQGRPTKKRDDAQSQEEDLLNSPQRFLPQLGHQLLLMVKSIFEPRDSTFRMGDEQTQPAIALETLVFENVSVGCGNKSKHWRFASATERSVVSILYRPSERGPPYKRDARTDRKLACGWAAVDKSIPKQKRGEVWHFAAISTLVPKHSGILSHFMGLLIAPSVSRDGSYMRVGLACLDSNTEGFTRHQLVLT